MTESVQQLFTRPTVLMEAAIVERIRRDHPTLLHPIVANALLPTTPQGCKVLRSILEDYIGVARQAGVPIILSTATWRATAERIEQAGIADDLNTLAADFLQGLRSEHEEFASQILIAGLMGCKNDCYLPAEGLSAKEAESFHSWQAEHLAASGVDLLTGVTLPALPEALGMAAAFARTALPYTISFVINQQGKLLDGTPLSDAVAAIDHDVSPRPLGFLVNCAHPSFICPAHQPPKLFERLIGIQANGSSLSHDELEGCTMLQVDDIDEWGRLMRELQTDYGLKLLGGCCGTDARHLKQLTISTDDSEASFRLDAD